MKNLVLITVLMFVTGMMYSQNIFPKNKGSKFIYVDAEGKAVFKQKFQAAKKFSEGLAAVKLKQDWGYIDEKGTMVIPSKYKSASSFWNGRAYVNENDEYYFIDEKGERKSQVYDTLLPLRAYYISKNDNLFGIIDSFGNVLEKPKFSRFGAYYQDKFTVNVEGKWGVWENGTLDLNTEELYFRSPDQFPIFSKACLNQADDVERKKCSDNNLLLSVYRNIDYPAIARVNKVEGTVVIEFIIDRQGQVQNPKIVRDIGGGCGDEALRIVKMYNQWAKAGEMEGKPVNTLYYLPIKFSLQ
ncbi:MAG: TonB family protein [Bacteroidota bacterium]